MNPKYDLHGVLLLNKPLDMTSAKAVFKVRALLGFPKAGHTGSLDPKATGMLPVCLGEATKYASYLLDADKQYRVVATLGATSTTGDSEGEIIQTQSPPTYSLEQLQTLCKQFTGDLLQTPSMFSALKHQGKPLYVLARQGKTVERSARSITIFSLTLDDYTNNQLTLTVHCSKGTYIRNLVEDMGEVLGCGAYVSQLDRITVGDYTADQQVRLADLAQMSMQERLKQVLPIETTLSHYPAFQLSRREAKQLRNGQKDLRCQSKKPGLYQLIEPGDRFIGLGEVTPEQHILAKRMLATGK